MSALREDIFREAAGGIQESFDPDLLRSFDVADQSVPAALLDSSRVKLNPDKLRLSGDGIFYTLQGEGMTMGLPAVFLRLHVCNLRCVWCDAYYTWNPKATEFWTESYERSVEEAAAEIEACWPAGVPGERRLVITGGEPLLQAALIDTLLERLGNWAIEIETSGTIMPTAMQLKRCQFNCSPKLAHSGNAEKSRVRPNVLQAINEVNSQFKFVVMAEDDVKEMEDVFGPYIDAAKIVLMPQGVTTEEVQRNGREVVEEAKRKGYRLLGRLHVDLWAARRRV
jgi:7-carboxy-7-deazaguanine synthase